MLIQGVRLLDGANACRATGIGAISAISTLSLILLLYFSRFLAECTHDLTKERVSMREVRNYFDTENPALFFNRQLSISTSI